jgi:hypothetical protein
LSTRVMSDSDQIPQHSEMTRWANRRQCSATIEI